MFGVSIKESKTQRFSCCLGESSYSLAAVSNGKLLFCERQDFLNKPFDAMASSFASDIERLGFIGEDCHVVLSPGQYELLQLDALAVPESEMAKAFRWKLKGLIELPLNDIAVDTFSIPPHGVVGQRKKVFVAVTLLSELKNKLNMFESAYLHVPSVTIAQMALRNLLPLMPLKQSSPVIVISLEENICNLYIFLQNQLYLERQLALTKAIVNENGPKAQNILLEIQRSIDYCLSELKLPEPDQIIFTPGFFQASALLDFLKQELPKEIFLMDLRQYLQMDFPMGFEEQTSCLYSIGGALQFSPSVQEITETA
ncbi:Uncharacterised protein (plasmid) [Legionella adelaidensis]|uniref:Type IV pilus assembly protein PilM n=1 Tax=Legionella adelaidensis TaxID=45056 RepID=A0A0W0R0P2_9GAMM|nr:hypothetical protein [Legionella adelaidensis]KTC64613.1 hypothetical protein Lade_1907 [Legionella adelaidensis]VEH86080.1 Uncharacterised protein [Legionella adelaidensis]